jgi:hypothetical protein
MLILYLSNVAVTMLQEDPPEGSPEDSGIPEPDTSPAFQCPDCLKIFTRKSSLSRHMNSAFTEIPKPEILTSPRILTPCVSKLTVNSELETLLGTVPSDYARWRLSHSPPHTQYSSATGSTIQDLQFYHPSVPRPTPTPPCTIS